MKEQLRQNRIGHDATVLLLSWRKMAKRSWMLAMLLALGLLSVKPAGAASLTLTFSSDPSGITLGGSGTAAATIAFGTVQAYGGAIPAKVTRSVNGTTDWTLSTPFDVKVTKTGLPASANYTMTAQLKNSALTYTWKLGAVTLSSAAPSTITAAGAYGSATAYTFSLTIPFSTAAGSVNNTLDVIVTAN